MVYSTNIINTSSISNTSSCQDSTARNCNIFGWTTTRFHKSNRQWWSTNYCEISRIMVSFHQFYSSMQWVFGNFRLTDSFCLDYFRCKSCARFALRLDKVKAEHADVIDSITGDVVTQGNIRFGSVEWGANEELCHAEGIEKLPTTRFYVNGVLQKEITGGAKKFQQHKDAIDYYLQKQQKRNRQANKKTSFEKTLTSSNAMIGKLLDQPLKTPLIDTTSFAWEGMNISDLCRFFLLSNNYDVVYILSFWYFFLKWNSKEIDFETICQVSFLFLVLLNECSIPTRKDDMTIQF